MTCQRNLANLDGTLTSVRHNMAACQQSKDALDQKIGNCEAKATQLQQETEKWKQAEEKALGMQKFIVGKLAACQNQVKDLNGPDGSAGSVNAFGSENNNTSTSGDCKAVIKKSNQDCVTKIQAFRANIDKIVLLEAGARKAYFKKIQQTNGEQVECLEKLASIQDNLGEQQYNNSLLLRELRYMKVQNGAYRRNEVGGAGVGGSCTADNVINSKQVDMLRSQVRKETELALTKEMAVEKQLLETQKQELAGRLAQLEIKSHQLKQEEARLDGKYEGQQPSDSESALYVRQLQSYMDGLQSFRKDLRETVFQTSNMASAQDLQVTTRSYLSSLVTECNNRLATATQKTDQILVQLEALKTAIAQKDSFVPSSNFSTGSSYDENMTDYSLDSVVAHWKNFRFNRWPLIHKLAGLLSLVVFDVVLFQLLLPTDSFVCVVLTLLLHGGLVFQCAVYGNWICAALFCCNVLLGLIFLIKPGWALRFSCSNGYITIT